nr:RNA-directed DNA polymerase, eukaryota, reverse transcriptase zinc-binding domain protein [Tanacetum cinerariifolium]
METTLGDFSTTIGAFGWNWTSPSSLVKVFKGALDHFYNLSGLKPNLGKSTALFRRIKDHVKQAILAIFPFKVGSLPVSYLGVPLVSKQIYINDCKRLIDKINERVLNWKNKMLTYAVPHLDSKNADSTIWITNKGIKCRFSTNKAWNDLKESGEEVQWWKIAWLNHCTPRNAFILLLSIQGRLSTHDRLLKWYLDKDVVSPFKISLAASVYFIWRERNKRLFAVEKKDWETVHNEVINTIRFKLSSVKIKSSLYVSNIEKTWKIKMNVQSSDEVSFIDGMRAWLSLDCWSNSQLNGCLVKCIGNTYGNVDEWDCVPEQLLTKSDDSNGNVALGDGSQCE